MCQTLHLAFSLFDCWRHPRACAFMCGCLVFVCLLPPCRCRSVALYSSFSRFPRYSRVVSSVLRHVRCLLRSVALVMSVCSVFKVGIMWHKSTRGEERLLRLLACYALYSVT